MYTPVEMYHNPEILSYRIHVGIMAKQYKMISITSDIEKIYKCICTCIFVEKKREFIYGTHVDLLCKVLKIFQQINE